MKNDLPFKMMRQRSNIIRRNFYAFFFAFSSIPSLLLEVFLRRNLGRRAFSMMTAICTCLFLAAVPFYLPSNHDMPWPHILVRHLSWFAFLSAFMWFSVKRFKEIQLQPSIFESDKLTTDDGDYLPFFANLKWNGKYFSQRVIEICLEPIPFVIAGLLMLLIGQYDTGLLLIFCAIMYGMSNAAAWVDGDHYAMDTMDIFNAKRGLGRMVLGEEEPADNWGFKGEKPKAARGQRILADQLLHDLDEEPAAKVL